MRLWNDNVKTTALAVLIAVAVASIPLIFNRTFYFEDDWQSYFLPNFLEIARLIKSGHLPLLTDRIWVGGMYLGEYQYAIFQPVNLLLYLLIDNINELWLAAAVFTLIHLAILAASTCSVALQLGIKRKLSMLVSLVTCTMPSVIYWDAKLWIVILVSLAWAFTAFSVLIYVYRHNRWFPMAVIASALVFLSGWPLTNVAFGLCVVIASTLVYLHTKNKKGLAVVLLSVLLGGLLAAPAMLPLGEMMQYSARQIRTGEWQTSIDMIPGLGVPSFMSVWKVFSGIYAPIHKTPILYVSWFIPLVLVNASWKKMWQEHPLFRLLVSMVLLFAAIVMLPGIWKIRWAFRFLPFLHIFVVMLAAYILSHEPMQKEQWLSKKTILTLLVTFYIAIVYAPEIWFLHLVFLLIIALLLGLHTYRLANKKEDYTALFIGHGLIFLAMSLIWPFNNVQFPAHPHDMDRSNYHIIDTRRLALFTDPDFSEPNFWTDVAPGNRTLYHYRESINGYSPIYPKGFRKHFCFNFLGATKCLEVVDYLFEHDKLTGLKHIDLIGVNTVVLQNSIFGSIFVKQAGKDWKLTKLDKFWSIYTRKKPLSRNIFTPNTVTSKIIRNSTDELVVKLSSHTTDKNNNYLIWSRPWYPGWRAYFNGKMLKAERFANILIGVRLPSDCNGTLVLKYWPWTLTFGLWIAAVAILLTVIIAIFGFRNKS